VALDCFQAELQGTSSPVNCTHRSFFMFKVFFALSVVSGLARAADSVSFDQAIQAAMKNSEALMASGEAVKQAEEGYHRVMSGLWPQLSFLASYQVQDASNISGIQRSFFPETQPQARLSATQALFRGFREYAGLRQARLRRQVSDEEQKQATRTFAVEFTTHFYSVIGLRKDLENYASQIEITQKRVKELEDRFRIGRSRKSEVLTARTAVENLRAQQRETEGRRRAIMETFQFLTGLPRDSEPIESEPEVKAVRDLGAYLKSTSELPDLKAWRLRLEAAQEEIEIQRGARLPSLDLSANYYLKRVGALEPVKWDLMLVFQMPLFQGGNLSSQIRIAESQKMQAEFQKTRAERLFESDVRARWEELSAGLKQAESILEAKKLAEANYKEQSREYRLGLVTNLEVLQALDQFQGQERGYDRAKINLKALALRLDILTGMRASNF
ncbi:MAG: TolC family protein, partial [Bdellovibrionales bacterium]|nr:TolC family protein [Bdellovibrionales bacterium]